MMPFCICIYTHTHTLTHSRTPLSSVPSSSVEMTQNTHIIIKTLRHVFGRSPFGPPSKVQRASSPSSRQQWTAALVPMKINDAAASSSRSSLPPPPPPPPPRSLSSLCLSLSLSPQHLSPPRCPPPLFLSSLYPSFIIFSSVSSESLSLPLPLLHSSRL